MISIEDTKEVFAGNGATTSFAFDFKTNAAADLRVTKLDTDGVETLLVLNTHYSVTLNGNQNTNPGGTVTHPLTGSALATGEKLVVLRALAATQPTDFTTGVSASLFELKFDNLVQMVQQLKERVARSLYGSAADTTSFDLGSAEQRANKYVTFDADGDVALAAEISPTTLDQTLFDSFVATVGATAKAAFFAAISGVTAVEQAFYAIVHPRTAAEVAAAVTPTNYRYPEGHVYRYGTNTTPGTTNMATAINNAILVMAEHYDGGVVTLPADYMRITSTINMQLNVSLSGHGAKSSVILADNCNGITFNYYTGQGQTILERFGLVGVNSTTAHGITQTGSLNDADELYAVTIRDVYITLFNVGIHFRQARQLYIYNNWIQQVSNGMQFVGSVLRCAMWANELVRAGGSGSGSTGILFDSFNFTSGAGVIAPEGWEIFGGNQIFGYDTGINVVIGRFFNIVGNDFACYITAIDFTTVQDGLNIERNFIQLQTATADAAIYGRGLASVVDAKINIRGNLLQAVTTTASIGVRINGSGNQNQNFVTVADNLFLGFDTNDILFNNAGSGAILNNRCTSSDPTNSISIPNVVSGTVMVRDNLCTKAINYTTAEKTAGEVYLESNIVSATTRDRFPGVWTKPAFAAGDYTANGSMTWTVASGDVITYQYTIVGNMMTVVFGVQQSTVGGTPNTTLQITIPGGKTATTQAYNTVGFVLDNGVATTGRCLVAAGGTVIQILRTDSANWTAATDTTHVRGQISFEIDN